MNKLQQPYLTINVKIEPSFIAIGINHLAVVLNNRIWYYELNFKKNGILKIFCYFFCNFQKPN